MRLLVLCAILAALVAAAGAQAATIIVTETADELTTDGDCSLREAVRASNLDQRVDGCRKGSGSDRIRVPSGLYPLSLAGASEDLGLTGDLDVTASVEILGAGALATVIDAGGVDRVLEAHGRFDALIAVTLQGLTLRGGKLPTTNTYNGGGIRSSYARLRLVNSQIVDNADAYSGGGIDVFGGSATLVGTIVSGNTARSGGGGIMNDGTLVLRRSSVLDNVSDLGNGGGIYNNFVMRAFDSVVAGNSAGTQGGGIQTNWKATLRRVTIRDNVAGTYGGGLFMDARGDLGLTDTLDRVTIRGNSTETADGGGIYAHGRLTIIRSVVSSNSSRHGAGIYYQPRESDYPLSISRTTIRDNATNSATGDGGGLLHSNGTATIADSTLTGNRARHGDGILNGGTTTITNSTISGNDRVGGNGGGVHNALATLTLNNVTLAQNTGSALGGSGGNLWNTGTANVQNTIVADPLSGGNCAGGGTLNDLGNNLESTSGVADCPFPLGAAVLGSLDDNGGPTNTHALGAESAALGAGAACAPTDQRGVPRPQGGACDVGAYELARCLGGVVDKVGTPGADRMFGTRAAEVFLTLGGKDFVNPRGGRDRVCTGHGNDRVALKDGSRDRADGGPGRRDRVTRDRRDRVRGFEIVG